MGIPYDPTKPAANDKPANDQAPMQQNFASIKTLIDVDHVDFSNGGYGKHQQVTFNVNNVPTPPVSPPVLFTNTVAGLPQLFYYSGSAAKSSTQYYISSAGTGIGQVESSTFLLGGLVIKTGVVQITNTTGGPGGIPKPVNFVVAFPNACLTVTAQPINSGIPSVANDYVYVSGVGSAATFNATATQRVTLQGNTVTFYYTAIGN